MAFEVFTRRMVPLVQKPQVTIQKKGIVSMNKAAHHLLGEPDAIELLYDADADRIGFRGVPRETDHAYIIRPTGANRAGSREDAGTYVVSGTAFFKYYEIDTSVSRRWPATLEDGILVLDLAGEGTVVTGNRSGATKASAASSGDGLLADEDSRQ